MNALAQATLALLMIVATFAFASNAVSASDKKARDIAMQLIDVFADSDINETNAVKKSFDKASVKTKLKIKKEIETMLENNIIEGMDGRVAANYLISYIEDKTGRMECDGVFVGAIKPGSGDGASRAMWYEFHNFSNKKTFMLAIGDTSVVENTLNKDYTEDKSIIRVCVSKMSNEDSYVAKKVTVLSE
ncbi:MAG: hypothetical protein LBR22_11350 [Desulfovibrio sp.]|jgi:hypothetical protein|nr:hypothetical protein [Desulfovibrio sp.]